MTPRETPGGIDTDQLAELMELVRGSKSVELKLTVPQERHTRSDRRAWP